jgi:hypothetical protein
VSRRWYLSRSGACRLRPRRWPRPDPAAVRLQNLGLEATGVAQLPGGFDRFASATARRRDRLAALTRWVPRHAGPPGASTRPIYWSRPVCLPVPAGPGRGAFAVLVLRCRRGSDDADGELWAGVLRSAHWKKIWSNPLERLNKRSSAAPTSLGCSQPRSPAPAGRRGPGRRPTTNGRQPTAATCPKPPWPYSPHHRPRRRCHPELITA